jgi:ParB family chromosome partitioning protein
LSPGHARALLAIEDLEQREKAAEEIIKKGLNVRDTEELVKRYLTKKKKVIEKNKNADYHEIEDKLKNIFGTKVEIQAKNKR